MVFPALEQPLSRITYAMVSIQKSRQGIIYRILKAVQDTDLVMLGKVDPLINDTQIKQFQHALVL